jgi:hypothetical protein
MIKLSQLFCSHKKVMIKRYRGPIRLRPSQQYYECRDCFKHIQIPVYALSPAPIFHIIQSDQPK